MTKDTRPLYRPEIIWTLSADAVPPLDASRMTAALALAASATEEATDLLDRLPDGLLADHGADIETIAEGAYAAGVQDVLAWLLGTEPADELADLLGLYPLPDHLTVVDS